MRWRLWITITLFLFLSAFLALGDRYVFAPPKYVFAPPKTTIASDEPPFGFFQILAPGDQLGKYCGGPSEKTWLKEYYCNIKATDRYLVIFTLWLALATIVRPCPRLDFGLSVWVPAIDNHEKHKFCSAHISVSNRAASGHIREREKIGLRVTS
jgi:hypothetical protein